MVARQSKSAFLYLEVRHALRSGNYVPGQRIDPATLAEEFHASATPVRFALYRLVGEGLIADHGRNGLHVPLPTEVILRDQYDWMRRLLQMACDVCFGLPRPAAGEEGTRPMRTTWPARPGTCSTPLPGPRIIARCIMPWNRRTTGWPRCAGSDWAWSTMPPTNCLP